MSNVAHSSHWTDLSRTLAGAGAEDVIAESATPANPRSEWFIHNPNAAGVLWANPLGGIAVVGGQGSVRIDPGQSLLMASTNKVSVIGSVASLIVTAAERR